MSENMQQEFPAYYTALCARVADAIDALEQQGMNVEDLNAQWYDTKNTWDAVHAQAKELDELINEFNEATGLLKAL